MLPWFRRPIYESKNSRFRPYSITTLIAFLLGRCLGRWFRE